MASRSSSIRNNYTGLSLAFYQRDKLLKDLLARAQEGKILAPHLSLLKQDTIDMFNKFSTSNLEAQRQMVLVDEAGVISGLYEIVTKCPHDRETMLYIMTTLDGILFGKRILPYAYVKL
mgnify:CR=1 FL=1